MKTMRFALTLLAIFAAARGSRAANFLEARGGDVSARAEISADTVTLSGQLTLTLTVTGPAGLEVRSPAAADQLLNKPSAHIWLVRAVGAVSVEAAGSSARRWQQVYRLYPYVPGAKVELGLAPVKAFVGKGADTVLDWPGTFTVEVTTTASADPDSLRSITGIESAPPAPTQPKGKPHWVLAAVIFGSTLAMIILIVVLIRRGGPNTVDSTFGSGRALRELEKLRTAVLPEQRRFGELAQIARLYIQEMFRVPSTKLTTLELDAALTLQNRLPPLDRDEWRYILERCDLAKFSDGSSSAEEGDASLAWLERTKNLIVKLSRQPSTGPLQSVRG